MGARATSACSTIIDSWREVVDGWTSELRLPQPPNALLDSKENGKWSQQGSCLSRSRFWTGSFLALQVQSNWRRTSWIISRSGLRKPVKTSLSATWTKRAQHMFCVCHYVSTTKRWRTSLVNNQCQLKCKYTTRVSGNLVSNWFRFS